MTVFNELMNAPTVPAIDVNLPTQLETATFALG